MNEINNRQVSGKKLYREPRLRVYGEIRSLTANAGIVSGKTDSNPSGMQKTV
jgi:hypothetical protein